MKGSPKSIIDNLRPQDPPPQGITDCKLCASSLDTWGLYQKPKYDVELYEFGTKEASTTPGKQDHFQEQNRKCPTHFNSHHSLTQHLDTSDCKLTSGRATLGRGRDTFSNGLHDSKAHDKDAPTTAGLSSNILVHHNTGTATLTNSNSYRAPHFEGDNLISFDIVPEIFNSPPSLSNRQVLADIYNVKDMTPPSGDNVKPNASRFLEWEIEERLSDVSGFNNTYNKACSSASPSNLSTLSKSSSSLGNTSFFNDDIPTAAKTRPGVVISASDLHKFDPENPKFIIEKCYNKYLERYKCPWQACKKSTNSQNSLLTHLRSVTHAKEKFRCHYCYNAFASAAALIQHLKSQSSHCTVRRSNRIQTYHYG